MLAQNIRLWLSITMSLLLFPLYFLYVELQQNEQERDYEELNQHASLAFDTAQRNLDALQEHLVSLRSMMTYQPELSRQQFDQFNAQSSLSDYGIVVYEWIPKTSQQQTLDLIKEAVNTGIFDFRFSRVGTSEVFYPIYYSASAQMNGLSLGINLADIDSIREGMTLAAIDNSLQLVISENMSLDEATTPEVRLLLPVFALNDQGEVGSELRGYVSAMTHFDAAMEILLGPVLSQRQNLGLEIYRECLQNTELLFTSLHQQSSKPEYRIDFTQNYANWQLRYQFVDLSPPMPWWYLSRPMLIVIGIGLIISLFLLLLRHSLYRRIRAEELAREKTHSLELAQNEYHNLFEKVVEGVYSATLEGQFLKVNPALARAFGYEDPRQMLQAVEHIGRQLHREDQSYQAFLETLKEKKEIFNYEWEGEDRHGNTIWLSENAYLNTTEDDCVVYQGTLDVITERKCNEQQLSYQANHDALTGLLNRTACQNFLEHYLQNKQWGVVLFIDLDGFKKINDTYGHGVGDFYLQKIADRLTQILRKKDRIARIGGDEFVIYFEGEMSQQTIKYVAERLQREVTQPVLFDGASIALQVSASIGFTFLGPHYQHARDILRDADLAMYEVKKNGKANYQVFSLALHEQVQRQTEFDDLLHSALEKNEFSLCFQPVVCLKDARTRGFEVLLRWYNPKLGQISPERFIPLAEKSLLIQPLGLWVITQALAGFRRLTLLKPNAGLYLNINLSPRQLQDDQLVKALPRLLTEARVAPENIRFELTESALDMNEQVVTERLSALRSMGFQIYIDDFGTGYSSLKRLVQFPIDGIKIDRSFVDGLEEDSSKQVMIEVIVTMARLLNLQVVAEGVETEAQRKLLEVGGCRLAQGYLFSRPLPEVELSRQLVST
ncbi:EAL domain-containing protein [Moritella sp. 36]|uniref:bifunctional diguanylate cyclase/phosphodiesterase n=1 Tax=Moritella sp. 36 TaxID=2746233 RepID=UPI001BA5F168|nr:EAL domain-containing protein [Moritella sp. 36]QUM88756.1 EAL domain-containing protein [Moritella sp. 36]